MSRFQYRILKFKSKKFINSDHILNYCNWSINFPVLANDSFIVPIMSFWHFNWCLLPSSLTKS